MAIKWVKKNIHLFGGDPDKITITGSSAGATSVGFQLISPKNRGNTEFWHYLAPTQT